MLAMGIAVKTVQCLPYGAPTRSCISMLPDHITISGDYSVSQTEPSPYKLLATWDKRMELIRVAVRGNKRIQGFLIQGRLTRFGPAVGRFINIADNIEATYQDCTSHPQVTFEWKQNNHYCEVRTTFNTTFNTHSTRHSKTAHTNSNHLEVC